MCGSLRKKGSGWLRFVNKGTRKGLLVVCMISVVCRDPSLQKKAYACAIALGVELNGPKSREFALIYSDNKLVLKSMLRPKEGDIWVDFCAGGAAHRRRFGGGKGQLIAKAVGLTGSLKPSLFDATAGLGGDAFALACLGCRVTMMERSPVAYALLEDGLRRAREFASEMDPDLQEVLDRMTLQAGNSIDYLGQAPHGVADVIYLDPMFPERQKSAAVKKEMAAFHLLIGADEDDSALLEQALRCANNRVVVKRPRLAPNVAGRLPTTSHVGKSCRFDLYALKSFDKSS